MANWNSLIQKLAGVDRSLRLTWAELDALVGGLPPSAAKHRAWWSGDRPHVRSWRDAGFAVHDLVMGGEVTFARSNTPIDVLTDAGATHAPSTVEAVQVRNGVTDVDLVLVTCVKTKLAEPAPAKSLYVSPLFTRERRYAESRGVPWFILSAEHGLVAPDQWLSPYERYLPDTPAHYRAAWGRWVAERLDLLAGPLAGTLIEIHAGQTYLDAVAEPLHAKGARLLAPLAGLSMGQRLRWYDEQAEPPAAPTPPSPAPAPTGSPEEAQVTSSFVTMLLDDSEAVTPSVLLESGGAGLKEPGLYSWWVDDAGATDLSRGLGLPVGPGLIYAGLAGATRWPSGKRSTNTLWSRLGGMHLGGRHEFSTFRRTLGSILANADGHESIDESALTAWMLRHLRVRTAVHQDPDVLGRLEADVLGVMDPPLNLRGMPTTPVRSRISELRRIATRRT